ncbi:MAG: ketol-acid reductoisomerase [archaeon]|jgi:ketol-acid reductoisomerase
MKVYHDDETSMEILKDKTIAVMGYGAQGRAQALCMRDSGLNVIIGLRPGKSFDSAIADKFEVLSVADAAEKADVIHILLPDEVQAKVYAEEIAPHIKEGNAISFSHGFNIAFKKIIPQEGVDVFMSAPKSPGTEERKRYLEGFGVPGLVAVYKDASGQAKEKGLAMAKAVGLTRAGVIECTFEQETYEDLFGEQAVLCGGTVELIKAGFETLTERGYPPEMAYFECLHEMKLIVDLIYEGGLSHMHSVISNTAEYGSFSRGPRIITDQTREEMKVILDEIETGKFADEWLNEYNNGMPNLTKMREELANHPIEKVGKDIRAMFTKKKE